MVHAVSRRLSRTARPASANGARAAAATTANGAVYNARAVREASESAFLPGAVVAAVASRATRGVIKIDVSNPYAIWANTTDSGIVGVIDHIIAEKAATLITCADPNAECAHCMNVDSEFVASVLTKRLLDRTPKARNTLLKWG